MGVSVDKGGHDDAAPGVQELRLGIFGPQRGSGAPIQNAPAPDDHAAVLEIAQRRIPGDQSAIGKDIHGALPFRSVFQG